MMIYLKRRKSNGNRAGADGQMDGQRIWSWLEQCVYGQPLICKQKEPLDASFHYSGRLIPSLAYNGSILSPIQILRRRNAYDFHYPQIKPEPVTHQPCLEQSPKGRYPPHYQSPSSSSVVEHIFILTLRETRDHCCGNSSPIPLPWDRVSLFLR